jgi:hypothetical protein
MAGAHLHLLASSSLEHGTSRSRHRHKSIEHKKTRPQIWERALINHCQLAFI